jgi:hypothetical protein
LHLFDTFAGLPATDAARDLHHQGEFAQTSLTDVKAYVGEDRVEYYAGFFPQSARGREQALVIKDAPDSRIAASSRVAATEL